MVVLYFFLDFLKINQYQSIFVRLLKFVFEGRCVSFDILVGQFDI
jgi:hypothetical protein